MNASPPFMSRLALGAALLTLSGCGPSYDYTDLTLASPAPVPVQLSPSQIRLPVGIAALVVADPQSSSASQYEDYDEVVLRSNDTSLLDVFPGPNEREFVLVGLQEGSTCVEVVIARQVEECIPTTISAPEG